MAVDTVGHGRGDQVLADPTRGGGLVLFKSGELLYTAYGVRVLEEDERALLAERHRKATSIHSVLVANGGNVEENKTETTALREEQERVERRLRDIRRVLAAMDAVVQPYDAARVAIGSEVVLQPLPEGEPVRYAIVGEGEGDPEHGFISCRSPLAAAVLGRQAGGTVRMPQTGTTYRIVSIRTLTHAQLLDERLPRGTGEGGGQSVR